MMSLPRLFRQFQWIFVALLAACGGGGGGGDGTTPDTTVPTASATSPASNATGFAVNSAISVTFSEAMAAASINASTFTLTSGAGSVVGTVSYNGLTATFTPASNLAFSTVYTATLTTGATDAAGNALAANHTWTFTTGTAPDTTPATVSSTSPANNATNVALNANITATFSEAMAAGSLNPNTFVVSNGVTGSVSYNGLTATFKPHFPLDFLTTYSVNITSGVTDAAGNALAADHVFTFRTRAGFNDTGIRADQCLQAGSGTQVACDSAAALALSPAQDGMLGRDASVATNDNADGRLGMRYSAVVGQSLADCVQDRVTGLIWEVKASAGLRHYSNQYTNLGGGATDASGFINAVNALNGMGLCGYTDWRLPSVEELHSIRDYSPANPLPAVDSVWFPGTGVNTIPNWSSSPYAADASQAWNVFLTASSGVGVVNATATIGFYSRSVASLVQLVRGDPLPAKAYEISAGGQEVTDPATGLIWRRCAEGMSWDAGPASCTGTAATYNHEAALLHAASQATATGLGWRLPNVKELSSIVDRSVSNPAIASAAFPATPNTVFWSSTPMPMGGASAVAVDFNDGLVIRPPRVSTVPVVRLVRDAQ